ncbi:uncharacterized protein LOC106664948 isoform X2 [Cimex lectularius]|uniref:Uncharacterized protein n=1 Tax=Cimex lectularius TaxID=79782 RepID=A0A8I6SM83_CIMLE|nr:uncharacterized protein LOC106664948 isoform X2 [Cimex lectularius]
MLEFGSVSWRTLAVSGWVKMSRRYTDSKDLLRVSWIDRKVKEYEPKEVEKVQPKVVHLRFFDGISDFHIQYFVEKFRRKQTKENDVITLNDVKDVVLYTFWGNLNPNFIDFFYTIAVDQFLRALLLYFQYFIRLFYIIVERSKLKKTHISHPNSKLHETKWRQQLSDLRFIVAREYSSILLGLKGTAKFHHFCSNNQSPESDRMLYENLHLFSLRILEVVLGERENLALYEEFNRLFMTGTIGTKKRKKGILNKLDVDLEFPFYCPKLQFKTPLVKELYRPNRDPILKNIGVKKMETIPDDYLLGVELGLLCNEEHFTEANFSFGILGKERVLFDPLFAFREDLLMDVQDCSKYEVKHKTTFGEWTVDRRQAYSVLAKIDANSPYNVKNKFYEPNKNARRERIQLREMWIQNSDLKCRLKYGLETGERAILTPKELENKRNQRILKVDDLPNKQLSDELIAKLLVSTTQKKHLKDLSLSSLLSFSSSSEQIQPDAVSLFEDEKDAIQPTS